MKPNTLNNWKEWQQIADGTLVLEDRLPVSRLSQFGDDVWNFNDSRKLRTLPKRPSRLRIEWHRYGEIISPELLRSAKVLGFFFVHYPAVLTTSTRLTKQGLSPSYCCQAMNILLSFLAEVYKQGSVRVTPVSAPVYYIQTLADISLMDIEKGLQHWQQPSLGLILRNLLRAFTSPLIQAYLPTSPTSTPPVQWTVHDLKTVDFRVRKQAPKGEGAGFRDDARVAPDSSALIARSLHNLMNPLHFALQPNVDNIHLPVRIGRVLSRFRSYCVAGESMNICPIRKFVQPRISHDLAKPIDDDDNRG